MHGTLPALAETASKIVGQQMSEGDKIVTLKFCEVAKVVWRGKKPAAIIAHLADCDIRTAKRILRGESPLPSIVYAACCLEILQPAD